MEMRAEAVIPRVRGRAGLYLAKPAAAGGVDYHQHALRQNQIQAGYSYAVAMCLGKRKLEYAISGLYFEFENMLDDVTAVVPPTYSVAEGVEYYAELALSATKDFIRVPLISDPKLDIATGYEEYFGQDEGNRLQFFSATSGAAGTHGKTFANNVNSRVYGMALVAQPVANDWTQDVIVARLYFDDDEQLIKPTVHPVYGSWELIFQPETV